MFRSTIHGARVGVNTDRPKEVEEGILSGFSKNHRPVPIEICEMRGAERKVQHFPKSRHDPPSPYPSYSVHRVQDDKCERPKG